MRFRLFFILCAFALLLAACGGMSGTNSADTKAVGSITVSDVWARAIQITGDSTQPTAEASMMPSAGAGAVSGAFMTIKNSGSTADKLIKAESTIADAVELHTMVDDNGVLQMRPVESIEVPANGEVQLKPGGFHVMLIGLKKDLTPGDPVMITLTFAQAGQVTVNADVRAMK